MITDNERDELLEFLLKSAKFVSRSVNGESKELQGQGRPLIEKKAFMRDNKDRKEADRDSE